MAESGGVVGCGMYGLRGRICLVVILACEEASEVVVDAGLDVDLTAYSLCSPSSLNPYRIVDTCVLHSGQVLRSCSQLARHIKSNCECWHGCASAFSVTGSRHITQMLTFCSRSSVAVFPDLMAASLA